jgi:tetratricopeptide (TPR) repeat protein
MRQYPTPHLNLARLYLKLNRSDEAAKELNQTIEIDPKGRYANEAKRLIKSIE